MATNPIGIEMFGFIAIGSFLQSTKTCRWINLLLGSWLATCCPIPLGSNGLQPRSIGCIVKMKRVEVPKKSFVSNT